MSPNGYKRKSFWLETAGPYPEREPLKGNRQADVCIIGGGFTGLSAALHLKQLDPGLDVAVLEQGVVAYGASGRNAGFCMALFGLSLEATALRFGLRSARQADDYMVRAVQHVEALIAEHGINCDYERTGLLTVATNQGQLRRLDKEMEIAGRGGMHATTWLEGAGLKAAVDSPLYLGARLDPFCGLLNPVKLARGIARAAEAAGAVIHDRTPVCEVSPGPGGRPRVETRLGSVTATKVIFATNAFSAQFPQLHTRQLPLHTYIVLTEPLAEAQLASIGWEGRQGIEDARNLIHYYRLTADNRLLFGGHDALYHYSNRVDRDRSRRMRLALEQAALRTFPGLKGVNFTHHWGGPISANLDLAPAIGRIGPDMLYSVGCMGHGVALTHLNGATLADLALERQTELTDVFFVNRRATPIPSEPLRFLIARGIKGALSLQDVWDESLHRSRGK